MKMLVSLMPLLILICAFKGLTGNLIGYIPVGESAGKPILVGNNLYVPILKENKIAIIDTDKKQLHGKIPVEELKDTLIAVNKFIYARSKDGKFTVIDTDLNQAVASVQGGYSNSFMVNGSYLYALDQYDYNSELYVIDINSHRLVSSIPLGSKPRKPLVHGNYLFIVNSESNNVMVIDISNQHKIVVTIKVGETPLDPIIYNDKLYVPNWKSSTVSVIDTINHKVISDIEVYQNPCGLLVVGEDRLLVTSDYCDNISVVDIKNDEVINEIRGDFYHPRSLIAYGQFIVVISCNNISILDKNTLKFIGKKEGLGMDKYFNKGQFLISERYLFKPFSHGITVIDHDSNTVAIIPIRTKELPVIKDGFLYATDWEMGIVYYINLKTELKI